jgi:hypothetical protein
MPVTNALAKAAFAAVALLLLLTAGTATAAAWPAASPRAPGEGDGPHTKLVISGAMLVDGTGAPPYGPVTIVVDGNRITGIEGGDAAIDASAPGTRHIDARGAYVVPGMVDTHVRILDDGRDMLPDYALKLLLAHGVTTITSMQGLEQLDWVVSLSKQSAQNSIVAPRIQPWIDIEAATPQAARDIVRKVHAKGIFGIGEGSIDGPPEAAKAVFAEANKLGMRVSWHMNPLQAQRMNTLDAARAGLHGLSHWYGLPETLFDSQALQNFPVDYNFSDVRSRFRQSGRLWKQAAPAGSRLRNRVLAELRALDFTLEPTFSVYEANRDYMGTRNAEWNGKYLHPALVREFTPSTDGRFAHFYDWSSTDEIEWKRNFRLWMEFVNEYKNRGGRVVAGSDAGYMWTTFGFGFIRNLEMLQEAGLSTLEVLSSATVKGAEHLRLADQLGTVEEGKLADLVIVSGNPLENLKVFYGTGFESLGADGKIVRGGGVRHTVKDGIVYDASKLLADVEKMVSEARR